jgi:hypothetical protein
MASGNESWHNSEPTRWTDEVERFHAALARLDEYLASDEKLQCSCERLFQGAIADSLTHVGQITLLRRVAGTPIRGENYSRARIEIGKVGADQSPAVREFD